MKQLANPFISSFLLCHPVKTSEIIPEPKKRRPQEITTAALIPWSRMVRELWALPEGWGYKGVLPDGISSQQFWAKVTRAAGRMGGKVGVAVRGGEFWAWAIERPKETEKRRRPAKRKDVGGWVGDLIERIGREEIVQYRCLSQKEWQEVRVKAKRWKGMILHRGVDRERGVDILQWVGSVEGVEGVADGPQGGWQVP